MMRSVPLDLRLVVAASSEGGIGSGGGLPWRLRGDMAFFKRLTMTPPASSPTARNAVIMGRKTWESIPARFRPLQNRVNIVISRNADLFTNSPYTPSPDLQVQPSLDAALAYLECTGAANGASSRIGHVYVIGGAQLYQTALQHPHCRYIFLTRVWPSPEAQQQMNYDTYFGPIPKDRFTAQPHAVLEAAAGVDVPAGSHTEGNFTYEFVLYEAQPSAALSS
ncbi:dihydrofolate reductase [Dimargaris verticillata]|uniref:Dihydrofolate reductase n=1 Tax=Dimargaris verticillata TaxID=2761393 RepID=A0A9W8B298_9FUNG|nr:dihydrofolate reductase [Dimargaris verticillata]